MYAYFHTASFLSVVWRSDRGEFLYLTRRLSRYTRLSCSDWHLHTSSSWLVSLVVDSLSVVDLYVPVGALRMPAVVNGVGCSVRWGVGHSCGLLLLDLPLPFGGRLLLRLYICTQSDLQYL